MHSVHVLNVHVVIEDENHLAEHHLAQAPHGIHHLKACQGSASFAHESQVVEAALDGAD